VEVKEKVRRALQLGDDETLTGSESHGRKVLTLSYAGAVLEDSWRFADLGIPAGAQVRAIFTSPASGSEVLQSVCL